MRSCQPRRLSPATAKTTASHSPRMALSMRVSRLPRISIMFRSGRRALSWARRRRLPVPTRAPSGKSASEDMPGPTRASRTSSRSGVATRARSGCIWVGRSFRLWTAKSMCPASRASSRALVKTPVPPKLRSEPVVASPVVRMIEISMSSPSCSASKRLRTSWAWTRASWLPRLPMTSFTRCGR